MMFVGEPVLIGQGVGMGLRKTDTELGDKFNAAIVTMKEDGSFNEFIVKWFDENAMTY